jgi:hypothetical protein
MDQPRSYYVVPRGQPALAVQPVSDAEFNRWYPQTDLKPGEPALYADGGWSVAVASKHSQAAASRRQKQLAAGGLPAQVLVGTSHGHEIYRVVVPGLRSAADAAAFVRVPNTRFGYRKAQPLAPG